MIAKHVKVPLLFISGDRHISEVSKIEIEGCPFTAYDLTSSSLTSPWSNKREESNRYREKEIVFNPNFAHLDILWNQDKLTLELNYYGKKQEVLQTHTLEF